MKSLKEPLYGVLVSGVLAVNCVVPSARADLSLTTLVSFNLVNGSSPSAGLVQGPDGFFYGTANSGGASNNGVIFRVASDGSLSTLVTFTGIGGPFPGANPAARLIFGTNGALYGTTSFGGTSNLGTVFVLTTNGAFTSLVSFIGTNGAAPLVGLVQSSDGNFYGTTSQGGPNDLSAGGDGTVFRMTSAGLLTTLWSFDNTNSGANPYSSLVQGINGNFYGTTVNGSSNGLGTVFEISPDGALTTLISFNNTNGANPQTGLLLARDGNFYGTTYFGGATNAGVIFRMTQAGLLTVLASFNNTNGTNPYGDLVQGADGSLYGTAQFGGIFNYGTVYQISPAGGLTALISFNILNGQYPVAPLTLGTDGNFYGTTFWGGSSARGTVFRFPPPPTLLTWKFTGGVYSFGWASATGQVYQVQYTTNSTQTSWNNLGSAITATNTTTTMSDSPGNDRQRLYRVRLLP